MKSSFFHGEWSTKGDRFVHLYSRRACENGCVSRRRARCSCNEMRNWHSVGVPSAHDSHRGAGGEEATAISTIPFGNMLSKWVSSRGKALDFVLSLFFTFKISIHQMNCHINNFQILMFICFNGPFFVINFFLLCGLHPGVLHPPMGPMQNLWVSKNKINFFFYRKCRLPQ